MGVDYSKGLEYGHKTSGGQGEFVRGVLRRESSRMEGRPWRWSAGAGIWVKDGGQTTTTGARPPWLLPGGFPCECGGKAWPMQDDKNTECVACGQWFVIESTATTVEITRAGVPLRSVR